MQVFKDAQDRSWELTLNHAVAMRVKAHLKINLYQLVDDNARALHELLNDPFQLVALFFVLCADQAAAKQVSEEDFAQGFSGDAYEAATSAFIEEFLDFFGDKRQRKALRNLFQKGRRIGERMLEASEKAIAALDPDAVDLESLAAKWKSSSGSVPGSSASTQALSPSPSS